MDADAGLGSLDGLELVAHVKDPSGGPVLPDLRGLTKSQARLRVVALGKDWDAQGTGWVVAQDPAPGTPLSEVTLCRLTFSDERPQKTADNVAEHKNEKTVAQ
jgi:beta-lactam-binding protein with PASTA domain